VLSHDLAGVRTREAPIEPHAIAQAARGAEVASLPALNPPRALRAVSGAERWLTVREAAEQLQVSTALVYRLVESGELAHVRVSNAIRVAPADLAVYLASRRRPGGGNVQPT
jgi:excisionase family DNA binding protein